VTTAEALEGSFREESSRALATLIRLLGDFDLAEEALQDAFATAVTAWHVEGVPRSPRAWLVAVAQRRAIDRLRRAKRFEAKARELEALLPVSSEDLAPPEPVEDDRLRLVFTCCHPALAPDAQVALTLRTVCGLTTEEIARAFLVPLATMAQRLVRAKGKIREARIPYAVPAADAFGERLESVLAVVYLVFNEGYAATAGDALVRRELCREAIRLGRLLVELGAGRPEWREAEALLALMLLHDSRREARSGADGSLVLLEEQDRRLWDPVAIAEGLERVDGALRAGRAGPYALQAAIAALHARAPRASETDWRQIAGLYDLLVRALPTPVAELNRAVAVAMVDGPERGLLLLDALQARGELGGYHLLHAARADLLRRLGRLDEARAAYRTAASLATLEPERRFLEARAAAADPREP
jgi:RNA polymerase sigma-70 factor (ECF subfamily)